MSATPSNSADCSLNRFGSHREMFLPPWLFRNGHVQTLVGTYVFGRRPFSPPDATERRIEIPLADGDRLMCHDDCPADWKPGDRVVLLLHGLAGSHSSPYMCRLATRFYQHHVRVIRLNWRGCGTGMSLARYPYHSGRSEDLETVVQTIRTMCPGSPLSVVGFSMGGNVTLKWLGEKGAASADTDPVTQAIAISPPIDLSTTIDFIGSGLARLYNSYFCKACIRSVKKRRDVRPDAVIPEGWFERPPRCMREFDETFTAPVCGFQSAADYYTRSSAISFLPDITTPTLIIAAQDDPVVPFSPFHRAVLSQSTQLRAPRHGGHVGFITHAGPGWLDQQILDYVLKGV